MKNYWSNSKQKLVSAEEGKIGTFEADPKNGACKKFMQLVQFILVVEIALFLGWACYSVYQSQNISSSNIEEDHLELNPAGALHNNFQLNPENTNESDYIKWQEKSSEHKELYPPLSSEPWSAKTQIVENPDSSTERDSVLLNTEDSDEKKIESVDENKIENAEDNKSPIQVLIKPIASESFQKSGTTTIKIETSTEENIGETTEDELKKIEDKLAQEINSELPLIAVSMSDVDSGIDENFNDTGEIEQQVEQEFGTVINEAQENEEVSVPKFIQILHDIDRAEAEAQQQISTGDIMPSTVENFKRYHFQISLGPDTGIEENDQGNQNSQADSENHPVFPIFFHVFFNASDAEENTLASEKAESITDPVFPFIHSKITFSEDDPEMNMNSWKMQVEIPREEEEPLKWWVSIPEFQDTREEGFGSEEESQTDSRDVASEFDNKVVSPEKTIFDLFFGTPDSQSTIVPEVEDNNSNEVVESNPESLDKVLTDLVSSILSSGEYDRNISEDPDVLEPYKSSAEILEHTLEDIITQLNTDIAEESITKSAVNDTANHLYDHVLVNSEINSMEAKEKASEEEISDDNTKTEEVKREEKVRKEYEDMLKSLFRFLGEDHEIIGTQTEKRLYQEEDMIGNEDTISEDEPEKDTTWKDEENWFHSQPTWTEETDLELPEEYLNDLFKSTEHQNSEYDYARYYSGEYMYED